MNKTAIALAADSAVTVGNHSAVHNSADKLFSLSNYSPVGAIIYANASFMQIPFELIIKEYRKYLDKKTFKTLEEYEKDFLCYLENNLQLFHFEKNEKKYVLALCSNLLKGMTNGYNSRIQKMVESVKRELSKKELKEIQKETLEETLVYVKKTKPLKGASFSEYVKNQYSEDIKKDIAKRFDWLGKRDADKLLKSVFSIYDKDFFRGEYVGMAIAGYGTSDIFPVMVHIWLGGIINGKVRFKVFEKSSIDENTYASIHPLAQTDVMETFLFGINESLINQVGIEVVTKLDDKIKSLADDFFAQGKKKDLLDTLNSAVPQIIDGIVKKANENYMRPILISISSLPIEELTSFAESLISLTSTRRQVAMDGNIGTVGGPIDVAAISKGDGFIWIKRKHHFDSKNNPYYFLKFLDSVYNIKGRVENETEKD